jgi:hypothetical protein
MKIETVSYQINWKRFKKGSSFFVPCIDVVAARKALHVVMKRLKIDTISKCVVEENIKGLRVWRV